MPELRRRCAALSIATLGFLGSLPGTAADSPYVTVADVELTRFLGPPPSPGSPAQEQDVAAVLAAQAARGAQEITEAQLDQQVSVGRFRDVMGPDFNETRLPATFHLARKACRESSAITAAAKKHWSRPRPYVADARVKPILTHATGGSYPSGHATCGYLWAIILGEMFPEKRDALFTRGIRYGMNRVTGGVHYPSDVEAAKIGAAVIAGAMFENRAFRTDLEAARDELRHASPKAEDAAGWSIREFRISPTGD